MTVSASKLLTLGLIILSLSISGCSKDDSPTDPGNTTEYMPYKLGNYWVYEMSVYQSDILMHTSIDTMIHIDTSFTYNGNTWYGKKGENSFDRNGTEGVWEIEYVNGAFGTPYLGFKANGHVGDTWSYTSDGVTTTVEITGVSATAVTPAGTYSGCYQYRETYSDGTPPLSSWIKVGVGPVKFMSEEGVNRVEIKLKSTHIG
jgi:hypothetical protein